tara:strand:+ start:348 stop:788 length:441 start_codon:yes stop_codon:yes gene_type:complete
LLLNPIKGFFIWYYKEVGEKPTLQTLQDSTLMRKIEQQMNFAISNKGNWKLSNTSVEYNENTNCSTVSLHGNDIATYDHNLKAIKISSCGWDTPTTKSRLNAILHEVKYGCSVFQKNFDWFVSYGEDVKDFFDGMILIDADHLEVA